MGWPFVTPSILLQVLPQAHLSVPPPSQKVYVVGVVVGVGVGIGVGVGVGVGVMVAVGVGVDTTVMFSALAIWLHVLFITPLVQLPVQ